MSETIATKEKLARAIEQRMGKNYDPRVERLIRLAREGHYDDYESPLSMPIYELVQALNQVGYTDLAERAKEGDFDCTKEEGEAWMKKEGWDLLRGKKL